MPTVTIDLQDGFDGDRVELWAGGERVWESDEVTTNLAVSLAASVPLELEQGETELKVVVPRRSVEGTLPLMVEADAHVSANLDEFGVQLQELAEPPYYL